MVQEVLQSRQEPWRWGAQWPATGSWQRPTERITEADALTTAREVAQELNANHSMVIWHLKQIGKVEKFSKWGPHELTKSQKNGHFEVLFYYSSSKQVIKQKRQFVASTMHLAQKLLMNIHWSGGSRSFAKETRALKMRSTVASHQKLTTTNWEQSSKLILLQLHEK